MVDDSHVAAAKSKMLANRDLPDSLGRSATMFAIVLDPSERARRGVVEVTFCVTLTDVRHAAAIQLRLSSRRSGG